MANSQFDVIESTTPKVAPVPSIHEGRRTIASMITALKADDGTYWTDARINQLTRNDLVAAYRAI